MGKHVQTYAQGTKLALPESRSVAVSCEHRRRRLRKCSTLQAHLNTRTLRICVGFFPGESSIFFFQTGSVLFFGFVFFLFFFLSLFFFFFGARLFTLRNLRYLAMRLTSRSHLQQHSHMEQQNSRGLQVLRGHTAATGVSTGKIGSKQRKRPIQSKLGDCRSTIKRPALVRSAISFEM